MTPNQLREVKFLNRITRLILPRVESIPHLLRLLDSGEELRRHLVRAGHDRQAKDCAEVQSLIGRRIGELSG